MRKKNIILIKVLDMLAGSFIISVSLTSLTGIDFIPSVIFINGAQLFIIYISIRAITYAVSVVNRQDKIDEISQMIKDRNKSGLNVESPDNTEYVNDENCADSQEIGTHEEFDDVYDPYPLAAGPDIVEQWKKNGIEMGAEYLFVVTDRFDWHDYPVYVMPDDDPEEIRQMHTREMVDVTEIYRLNGGL